MYLRIRSAFCTCLAGLVAGLAIVGAQAAFAGDLKIDIPKRTRPTPVQKLNQEGVKEVQKHRLEKAEKLFYQAYLLDPDDPFTLNNLGYISELQGDVERAERYYELSAKQDPDSDSVIAVSSVPALKGKKLAAITGSFATKEMQVNRGNIEAMSLLKEGRDGEAEGVLLRTLQLDPQSPFTLNNLGYTMEAEGNNKGALRYYSEAASLHSPQSIVVAFDERWRGKPISEVAENNVNALQKRIEREQSVEDRAAQSNLQGVFALNHNEPEKAKTYFQQAYQLDPQNAFALNNMGYVAEMNGDQETAQDFYDSARQAAGGHLRVTIANHAEMVGMHLNEVAGDNAQDAEANLAVEREARRRETGPIELKTRDNTPVPGSEVQPSEAQPRVNNPISTPSVPRPSSEQYPQLQPGYVPRPPQ